MFTRNYNGGWIHGYFDSDECTAQLPDYSLIKCRSYRAAQLAITRRKNGT
jgi:hypothetical protein